jgi:hypothetical protein
VAATAAAAASAAAAATSAVAAAYATAAAAAASAPAAPGQQHPQQHHQQYQQQYQQQLYAAPAPLSQARRRGSLPTANASLLAALAPPHQASQAVQAAASLGGRLPKQLADVASGEHLRE